MNQVEMQERVEELFKDEEYRKKFFALKSAEEMSDELAKHDIDVSAEELRKIYSLAKRKETGDLSDEELEKVAGGSMLIIYFGTLLVAASVGLPYAFGCGGYGD